MTMHCKRDWGVIVGYSFVYVRTHCNTCTCTWNNFVHVCCLILCDVQCICLHYSVEMHLCSWYEHVLWVKWLGSMCMKVCSLTNGWSLNYYHCCFLFSLVSVSWGSLVGYFLAYSCSWATVRTGLPNLSMFLKAWFAALLRTVLRFSKYFSAETPVVSVNMA